MTFIWPLHYHAPSIFIILLCPCKVDASQWLIGHFYCTKCVDTVANFFLLQLTSSQKIYFFTLAQRYCWQKFLSESENTLAEKNLLTNQAVIESLLLWQIVIFIGFLRYFFKQMLDWYLAIFDVGAWFEICIHRCHYTIHGHLKSGSYLYDLKISRVPSTRGTHSNWAPVV